MSIPRPSAYDRKARLYARSRWDYPQAAIEQIVRAAEVSSENVIADIGSGTGMLARHFLPHAKLVYGVEPGADMRRVMDELLGPYPNFRGVRGSAEATLLPDQSVDLITAGMAIHWFEPEGAALPNSPESSSPVECWRSCATSRSSRSSPKPSVPFPGQHGPDPSHHTHRSPALLARHPPSSSPTQACIVRMNSGSLRRALRRPMRPVSPTRSTPRSAMDFIAPLAAWRPMG